MLNQSEVLFERAKKVSPGGVHSPVRGFRGVGGSPVFMKEARGARITDVDGKTYIDYCMSWGPLLFGHRDPEIEEAVRSALSMGWSFGTAEPYSLELAELMTTHIPALEEIRFVNSGTEAVMAALRLARAATGRSAIVKFDGCYHGHVDSMLVRAGSGLAEMANPDSAGVSQAVAAETIVAPLNDLKALQAIFDAHGKNIAAIIVEPVPANNGLLLQTDSFLRELRDLTTKYGSLLIFDEVITGFRIAFGGMAEKTGIRPDLLTYGKVIGGGFPVGAYGGRRDLMEMIAPAGPVYQAGTLSANPVAMRAGTAMLKKLLRDSPYSNLKNTTQNLTERLAQVAQRGGISFKIHTQSYQSLFWSAYDNDSSIRGDIRSVQEIPTSQKALYSKLFHALLNHGVYFAPSGFEVCFLSTAHDKEALDFTVHAFEKALNEIS
jgi:glutamate-1-semialdehyde 2,1-aminomutase